MKIYILLIVCIGFFFGDAMAQNKKLNWVEWDKVSAATKAKLKQVKISKNETIYSSIKRDLDEAKKAGISCTVDVAIIDLDGDGIPGYAIGYGGSYYCGSHGCSFMLYEKSGRMSLSFYDEWELIKPAKNGVIASNGKFFPLKKNSF